MLELKEKQDMEQARVAGFITNLEDERQYKED